MFRLSVVLIALIILNIYLWFTIWLRPDNSAGLYFLSVGQGDASLLELYINGRPARFLIDTGPDGRLISDLLSITPWWGRRLDLLIISHPEKDHAGGLSYVINRFRSSLVLHSNQNQNLPLWQNLITKINSKKITNLALTAGDHLSYGHHTLTVLHPPARFFDPETNNNSLVLNYAGPDFSSLFTGDISADIEDTLTRSGFINETDILKISHHGSKYSSSDLFLAAARPLLSLIGVGASNSYGHPAPIVLTKLQNINSHILRTDLIGSFKISSTSNGLTVTKL